MIGIIPDIGSSFNQQIDSVKAEATRVSALNPFNDTSKATGQDLISFSSQTLRPDNGGFIDPFFNWYANDGTSFQSIFGYQFVVTNGGQYVNHFFLPIGPQNISMSVPVATSVAVTMKGITEDNNAAPLRQIVISGTTGTWHTAQPAGTSNSTVSNTLDYLFRNTISAAGAVASQFNKTVAAFSGNPQATSGPLNYQDPTAASTVNQSGYWTFHNLQRFLDFYITNKKTRAGKDMRFTFQMHKDQMYYDCILTSYSWQKVAGTTEYAYTINLTAYRRRPAPVLEDAGSSTPVPVTAANLNTFASIINGLKQTRVLISSAANVLRGIRQDADANLFQPMREAILLGSDALGLVKTMADFPQAIQNSAKFAIQSAVQDVTGSAADLRRSIDHILNAQYGLRGSPSVPGSSALTSQLVVQATDGKSQLAVRPETASPSEAMFKDPVVFAPVFDMISVDTLNVPDATNQAIQDEVNRVRLLTIDDWNTRRNNMRSVAVSISEALGGGSATYNQLLGLPPPKFTYKQLSTDDIVTLSQINDAIMAVDAIIVQLQNAQPNSDNDYYGFYGAYAVANGLVFNSNTSKFFVPFPHDGSLESLAQQYLGDYSRWTEIAALNGLKEPYVDEDGFSVPLLSNAAENSVHISDPSDLYVGEIVTIRSSTRVGISRQIETIQEIAENDWLVTFTDGPSILGFTVEEGANLFAYLPDTVNSSKLIAIPSTQPVNVPGKVQLTPGQQDLNALGVIAKVDFLLQSDGQLVLNSTGDVQLAQGMTNLVQAANIRLNTPQGSVLQWPTYGNPIQVGASIAEINVQDALRNLSKQFQQDPRFVGILAGRVHLNGPASVIDILLGVSGTQLNLPITTQLLM
jgi:phage baseplate assembly protein W